MSVVADNPAASPPDTQRPGLMLFGPRHRYVVQMLRQAARLSDRQRDLLIDAMQRHRQPGRPRGWDEAWQVAHGHAMDIARREGRLIAVGRAWDAARRLLADTCRSERPRRQEALVAAVSGELLGVCLADVMDPADVYVLSGPWHEALHAPDHPDVDA